MVYGQVFHQHLPDDCFIMVNVGGFRQRLDHKLLKRFPQTRLGRLLGCNSNEAILELCDDFSPSEMEFYFDRNPCFFCYILNFYLTGKIHLVEGLCIVSFCQEMEYWGIREGHLDFCCSNKFHELMAFVEDQWSQESDVQLTRPSTEELSADLFEGSWCADIRRNIWILFEKPVHSTLAKVMAVVSLGVVIGSIISMCIHTMDVKTEIENPSLRFFDSFCVFFFSAEFFLRLSVAPSVRTFLRNTIVPGIFTFSTLIYFAEKDSEESELQTIPIGWWWATISMTTVGYGDTFPVTLPGKMIGTLCIICGLLIVALPIANIFNKFTKFYQRQKDMDLRHKNNVPSAAREYQSHESNGEM